jgi:D-aminoacyl-tRNA deacylase
MLTNNSMRAVIQRVREASVTVGETIRGSIDLGLVVFVAVEATDNEEDIEWLSGKILRLRIFNDEHQVMNRSVLDAHANILMISQFTLFASTRKGNRPSFIRAAPPDIARPLCAAFERRLAQGLGHPIASGEFGAHMLVQLVNDGPVTIVIDSRCRE